MSDAETAALCAKRIRELYSDDLGSEVGVLHVTSVWRGPEGPPTVLRIKDATPTSVDDAFALALARARSDAIVTSGRNLRDEVNATHDFAMCGLEVWRRHVLGKPDPPLSVVLTSGREVDLSHPVFRAQRALVYSGPNHPPDLLERASEAGVEVVVRPDADLRSLIAHLRSECGAATVSIEVGASTARGLYSDPLAVDELMLSVYRAPTLPDAAKGPPFVAFEELCRALPYGASDELAATVRPGWSFHRLRRASSGSNGE